MLPSVRTYDNGRFSFNMFYYTYFRDIQTIPGQLFVSKLFNNAAPISGVIGRLLCMIMFGELKTCGRKALCCILS